MKIIIYHENRTGVPCQDGIAAAKATFNKHPDAMLVGWTYQDAAAPISKMNLPNVQPGDEIIIVDFSFPKEVLNFWEKKHINITVLDHHKSAWSRLQGFTSGILKFDMGQSGVRLAWEHVSKKPIPPIYQYVEAQDLWRYNLPHARDICAGIVAARTGFIKVDLPRLPLWKRIYNHFKYAYLSPKEKASFLFFDAVENCSFQDLERIFQVPGELQNKKRQDTAKKIAKRAVLTNVLGHTVPCIELFNSEEYSHVSLVLEILYNQYPALPFSAGFIFEEKGAQKWELRSSETSGFDCQALAETVGGGGHVHSAGFTLSELQKPLYLNIKLIKARLRLE